MEIAYDERGLVPVVVQDWRAGEVLTLAYANAEAVARTRETGELHLWTPLARRALAQGRDVAATSQAVRALRLDCDGDALLALVEPAGPACHTGERTCFFTGDLEPPAPHEALPALERTLPSARASGPAGSYTVELLDDPPLIGEKVEEEAEEVARAAREETDERVDEEAADVLYHLLVLLAQPRAHAGRRARRCSLAAVAERADPPGHPSLDEVARARAATTTSSRCATRSSTTARRRSPRSSSCAGADAGAPGLPAGVRRAGPARRALVVHRRAPAPGAALVAGRRRRPLRARRARRSAELPPGPAPRTLPPFTGGAVGFFGYDLVRTVEPLGEPNPDVARPARTWR